MTRVPNPQKRIIAYPDPLTYSYPEPPHKTGGIAIPEGYDVNIWDENDESVGVGEAGEIQSAPVVDALSEAKRAERERRRQERQVKKEKKARKRAKKQKKK